MKHILNNLTEEEKNTIREQHTGGIKIDNEKFKLMVETKLGDPKPLVQEQFTGSNSFEQLSKKFPQAEQVMKDCVSSLNLKKLDGIMKAKESGSMMSMVLDFLNPFSSGSGKTLDQEIKEFQACVSKKLPDLAKDLKSPVMY